MRGLDPRIHHFPKMDCRVKPGNDEEVFDITNALSNLFQANSTSANRS
jgi:hypothetical protein